MQNIRGGQIWVQINPIRFWVNQVGKNLNSIWTCNQIRIIFGSDKKFWIEFSGASCSSSPGSRWSKLQQIMSAHHDSLGWCCSRACVRETVTGSVCACGSCQMVVLCVLPCGDCWLAVCVCVVRGALCICGDCIWLCVCVMSGVLCVVCACGYRFHIFISNNFFFKFYVAQSEFWIGSGWINSWLRGSSASQTRIFSDRIRLFATPTKYGLSTTSN